MPALGAACRQRVWALVSSPSSVAAETQPCEICQESCHCCFRQIICSHHPQPCTQNGECSRKTLQMLHSHTFSPLQSYNTYSQLSCLDYFITEEAAVSVPSCTSASPPDCGSCSTLRTQELAKQKQVKLKCSTALCSKSHPRLLGVQQPSRPKQHTHFIPAKPVQTLYSLTHLLSLLTHSVSYFTIKGAPLSQLIKLWR